MQCVSGGWHERCASGIDLGAGCSVCSVCSVFAFSSRWRCTVQLRTILIYILTITLKKTHCTHCTHCRQPQCLWGVWCVQCLSEYSHHLLHPLHPNCTATHLVISLAYAAIKTISFTAVQKRRTLHTLTTNKGNEMLISVSTMLIVSTIAFIFASITASEFALIGALGGVALLFNEFLK